MEVNKQFEPKSIIIYNGKIILENRVVDGTVIIRHGQIMDVITNDNDISQWHKYRHEYVLVDANKNYVMPGMIDMHCDAIEKEIQPRPNTLFPIPFAFQELESKLPLHGITTMFHSLSLGVGLSIRGENLVTELIDYIHSHNKSSSLARNLIHLRYEVSYLTGQALLESLIRHKQIHLLSLMDHAPGIGQYHKEGAFERYVMKNQGVTIEEVPAIVDELQQRRKLVTAESLKELTLLAREHHIPLAAHDDDSERKINDNTEMGIQISEFPINKEVASYAQSQSMQLCLGAPNIVRGGSHDGNLNAKEIIEAGKGQIVCSDYYPSSLLHAVFTLAEEKILSLPEAVKLVTLNPAQAVKMSDKIGSIRIGKAADLLIVDHHHGLPSVRMTILDGEIVYSHNRIHLS